MERLRNKQIVSMIQASDTLPRWFVVARTTRLEGRYVVYEIVMERFPHLSLVNASYHAWMMIDDAWSIKTLSRQLPHKDLTVTYAVLLPLLCQNHHEMAMHTLVTFARDS